MGADRDTVGRLVVWAMGTGRHSKWRAWDEVVVWTDRAWRGTGCGV